VKSGAGFPASTAMGVAPVMWVKGLVIYTQVIVVWMVRGTDKTLVIASRAAHQNAYRNSY